MAPRKCPHCGRLQNPPAVQGTGRCRFCARPLHPGGARAAGPAEVLDALPADTTDDPAPDVPDALPADAPDPAPEAGVPEGLKSAEELGLTPSQWDVYVHLSNTLGEYRASFSARTLIIDYLRFPFQMALVGSAAYLALYAIHGALYALGRLCGDWVNNVLYLAPLLVLSIGLLLRFFMEEEPVRFYCVKPRAFDLGRLGRVFDSMTQAVIGAFFVACFVCQVAILQWTPRHAGLPIAGGFSESFWLSLDNVCGGYLFEVGEWLHLGLGPRVPLTHFAATVFWLFRLAYAGLAFIMCYDLYLKFRYRNFLKGAPGPRASPAEVAGWCERLCGDRRAWPRRYFDECLFLYIVAKYLRGDYALARLLGRNTQWLRVAKDVRALFLDEDNYHLLLWG